MRLVLLLAITLLTVNIFGQTTEEEYNYVTKGYKIQLDSGLDMKKGYSFKDIDSWGVNYGKFSRESTFKQLYRDGETTPCATLMILRRTDTNYEAYICIPHSSSTKEMWNRTYKEFVEDTNDWTQASRGYTWGMLKMISHISSQED